MIWTLILACAEPGAPLTDETGPELEVVEARVTGEGWWDPVRVVLQDGSVPEPLLTTADGTAVPLTAISDDVGVYAWRASEALPPGDYYLRGADGGGPTNPVAFNVTDIGQLADFDLEELDGSEWRLVAPPWTPDGWSTGVLEGVELSVHEGELLVWLGETLLDEGSLSADEHGLVSAALGVGELRFGVDADRLSLGGLEGHLVDSSCWLHEALGLDTCEPLVFHAGMAR